MELNFDKEIDAILRKARDGESAFTAAANPAAHLDADEISAFAENALPANAKMRSTAHLADCDRCRKILSNIVLLNAETESEIVHADEKIVAAPAVPWYRRLFLFPNLAYSLGALALVFGGLIVFTALQGLDTFQNAEISQVSNKPMETQSAPTMANSNSMANSANDSTSNTAFNSNKSVEAMNPSVPSNAAPMTTPLLRDKDADYTCEDCGSPNETDGVTSSQDSVLSKNKPSSTTRADKDEVVREENKPAAEAKKNADDKRSQSEKQELPEPNFTGGVTDQAARKATTPKKKADSSKTGETTSAGGKTFRRENNVWYDTTYNNQATTNITRGSAEYKKLDKDLRVIVENLGGTVVIVWKSKAYRFR